MAAKARSPSDKAFSSATRSAQTVRPYEAFSTLQPPYTRPSAVISAAPTLKPEYGATACSRACRAAVTSAAASKPLKDALQQRDERVPHAARGLNYFFLGQLLIEDSGRHVRDARNAQHLDAHVPGADRF